MARESTPVSPADSASSQPTAPDPARDPFRTLTPATLAPVDLPASPHTSYNPGRGSVDANRSLQTENVPSVLRGTNGTPTPPPASASESPRGDAAPDGSAAFTLQKQIARGGFGEVWEAMQNSLERVVAIKRVRRDIEDRATDTIGLRRLFKQEALTAAALEHPNIVPIHDLSFDDHGRVLLAMKLVRGTAWDKLLREDWPKLAPEDFLAKHLQILVGLTQAVAFTHSRGIVHRDLKPSQVMVGEFGEVLLMDWGLAVAFDPALLSRMMQDRPGAGYAPDTANASNPAGTPAFMAPEQTESTAANIGPWTDVFLLGGTLYYLLTGTAPFDANDARLSFLRAAECEIEPPLDRAKGRMVPPELNALALRALARERDQRLDSAKAFLDALQDYLTGAGKRRESIALTERVRSLLGDADGSYRVLGECLVSLGNARALWAGNPAIAELREQALREHVAAALENNDLVLAKLHAERLSDGDVKDVLLAKIAERHAASRRRERQRRYSIAAVVLLLAVVAAGGIKHHYDQLEANRLLQAQVARAKKARGDAESLVNFMLGDLRDRLKPLGQLAVLDALGSKGLTYYDALPKEEMTPGTRMNQATMYARVADVRMGQGNLDAALANTAQAIDLFTELVKADPSSVEARINLSVSQRLAGSIARERGDLEGALAYYRSALGFLESAPKELRNNDWSDSMADTLSCVGQILELRGDLDGALGQYAQIDRLLGARLAREPNDFEVLRQVGTVHVLSANIKAGKGDLAGAQAEYEAGRDCVRHAMSLKAGDVPIKRDVALACIYLGRVKEQRGDSDGALEDFRAAADTLGSLVEYDPQNSDWKRNLGVVQNNIGQILEENGRIDEAAAAFEKFRSLFDALAAADPTNRTWQFNLAIAHAALGGVHEARRDFDAASNWYGKAEGEFSALVASDPTNTRWQREVYANLAVQARLLYARGEFEASLAKVTASRDKRIAMAAKSPASIQFLSDVVPGHQRTAVVLERLGRMDEAAVEYAAAGDAQDALIARDPGAGQQQDLAELLCSRGDFALRRGKADEASQMLVRAREAVAAAAAQKQDEYTTSSLVRCLLLEAGIAENHSDADSARRLREQALRELGPARDDCSHVDVPYADARARALLLLDRAEEVRPLVDRVVMHGWPTPTFADLCAKHGVEIIASGPSKAR